jgi:Tol biopolymer transport system component
VQKDLTATRPIASEDRYVYDRGTGITTFAEVTQGGGPGTLGSRDAEISPDGGYVTFVSQDSNVVTGDTNGVPDVFIRNLATNQTRRVTVSTRGVESNGYSFTPTVAPGGIAVAFASAATNLVSDDVTNDDPNNEADVFVNRP